MDNQEKWEAVLQRDPTYDRQFVYAVKTTRIFCRPTCPSRRPKQQNVEFFKTVQSAQDAGYRPCQRCHPHVDERVEPQLTQMVAVCRYLEQAHEQIPTLDALAKQFALSPAHLQRTFKRVIGISPRQYADAYRQGRLKQLLKDKPTVTEALYAAGYNGSSQFYEGAHDTLGMTPIHYRQGGHSMTIRYTITACELGNLLVAATELGVCKVSLADDVQTLLDDLHAEFPQATINEDDQALTGWVGLIINYIDGETQVLDLPLDIQATSFQRRVWEALRAIPYGSTQSYKQIAQAIGQPTAARAVARACATNPVAMVIPCHRIVRQNGDRSGYRWGIERKHYLLDQEAAQRTDT